MLAPRVRTSAAISQPWHSNNMLCQEEEDATASFLFQFLEVSCASQQEVGHNRAHSKSTCNTQPAVMYVIIILARLFSGLCASGVPFAICQGDQQAMDSSIAVSFKSPVPFT